METAKKADVAILALGESPPTGWKARPPAACTLGFTGSQEKLLEAVVATGKPVILVVLAGRPLEIKWAAEHVPAILEAWRPGIEAGHAIADVLFGDVNPSGKLPASLPRAVGQEPLYYAQLPTGRPAQGVDLSHMPRQLRRKVRVALHGRGEFRAVSLRLGAELHALQLLSTRPSAGRGARSRKCWPPATRRSSRSAWM